MNDIPTYKVRDWDRQFETSESRKRRGPLAWVGVPTKHDGRGLARLRRLAEWPALYGAWVLILQVAAKSPVRGTLGDLDGAYSALDIADKTGLPEELVQRCLTVLSDSQLGINWLERTAQLTVVSAEASRPQQSPADSSRSQQTPADSSGQQQTPADISRPQQTPADSSRPQQTPADSSRPQQTPADSIPTEQNRTEPDRTEHNPTEHNLTEPNRTKTTARSSGSTKRKSKSVFDWIHTENLSDPLQVLAWHDRAMKVKENPLVTDSDYSRINALAAAATAVDGKDDPKAFFVWCVATDKFQSLTQTAEDQARQTLRQIRRPQSGSVKNLFEMVEARSRPNSTVIDFDADPSDYSGGDA